MKYDKPKTHLIYEFLGAGNGEAFTTAQIMEATGLTAKEIHNGIQQLSAHQTLVGVEAVGVVASPSGPPAKLWRLNPNVRPGTMVSKLAYSKVFEVTIPDEVWEANSALDAPNNCLYATLVLNGLYMHLEAWQVEDDENGEQHTNDADYDKDLDWLNIAVHGDGRFQTLTIRGHEYVVVASPYC